MAKKRLASPIAKTLTPSVVEARAGVIPQSDWDEAERVAAADAPDYACPQCKEPDRLDITALVKVRLVQTGPGEFETDSSEPDDGSHEWDDTSDVLCAACGWTGHMRDCDTARSQDKGATASPQVDLDSLYRAAAKEEYQRDGEIEIDDNAVISHGDDNGAYVAAWIWVDGCALCKRPGGIMELIDNICDECRVKVEARAEETGESEEEALEALKLARSLTNALSSALAE